MVSAIITTHCREPEVVERALKSVIAQTYRDIEIILVDDSTPDFEYRNQIRELAENLDPRIKYIPHEVCKGACAARNTGLECAKGEFVAFLDDDDEWLPDKTEKQLKAFTSGKIALVYCDYTILNETTGDSFVHHSRMENGKIYSKLIFENFVGSASFPLIRTKALRKAGGFDTEMKASQDLDAWLRISRIGLVNFVDEPLSLYHIHEGEQITKKPQNKISGFERIIEKNLPYLRNHKKAYAWRLLLVAPYYAMNKQLFRAFFIWLKAVSKNPLDFKNNIYYAAKILKARLVHARHI